MTIGGPSQCFVCVRFRSPFDEGSKVDGPSCDAFPGGIPAPIIGMEVDHREPYPGDHGIQWRSDGRPYPEMMLHSE